MGTKTVAKKVFSFAKSSAGVLDISMYGTLYGNWFNGSEEAALRDAIRGCGPADEIRLHINSDGGDMFAGIAIRNLLDAHPGEVTCIVEGLAASAASIAAMAGRTVMRSGAMMMVHNPWTVVAGDADDMRTAADMLDKSRDALVAIYREKTGKSVDELKALLKAETWMTAAEAVEAGFADDEDEDEDDTLDVVALSKRRIQINDVAFKSNRMPPQILAMARSVDHPNEENSMKTVFAALSLKDNATEAEALSVVNRIAGERAQLLAFTGKDSTAEALGVLAAWKTASDEVVALKSDAEQKAKEQAAKDFDSEIAAAKKSGLLASSDEHKRNKQALSFKGKDDALASLRGFLGALDPLVPVAGNSGAPVEPPAGAGSGPVALTDEEKRVAAMMSVPLDKALANKQRLLARASHLPSQTDDDNEDAA